LEKSITKFEQKKEANVKSKLSRVVQQTKMHDRYQLDTINQAINGTLSNQDSLRIFYE
jgi:hypothetical protein